MNDTIEVHVLRHAHSSRAVAGERDHLRDLDQRGEREVAAVLRRMLAVPPGLQRVVCSTARRARQTLAPLLVCLPHAPILYDDALYAMGPDAYERAVRQARDVAGILLVGHNPAIEALRRGWCPGDNRLAAGIGTACWATVQLRRGADHALIEGRLVDLRPPT